MASGVFHGFIKPEEKGFEVYGEVVKVKASDFVYRGIGRELNLMIECLANFENFGALPQKGGLLDQSPLFVEALRVWNSARFVFEEQKKKIREMAKKLGAFNGRRR